MNSVQGSKAASSSNSQGFGLLITDTNGSRPYTKNYSEDVVGSQFCKYSKYSNASINFPVYEETSEEDRKSVGRVVDPVVKENRYESVQKGDLNLTAEGLMVIE